MAEIHPWYAIHTKSNHEKFAVAVLSSRGFDPYLPTYRTRRRWSDRTVELDRPFFPGYVFCRFNPLNRLLIMKTPGVVSIVGFGSDPAPISDVEIQAVQAVLQSGHFAEPCPYLREGQRVRIMAGSLQGVEGILTRKKSDFRLVISVEMLQRSISVEIDHESVVTI